MKRASTCSLLGAGAIAVAIVGVGWTLPLSYAAVLVPVMLVGGATAVGLVGLCFFSHAHGFDDIALDLEVDNDPFARFLRSRDPLSRSPTPRDGKLRSALTLIRAGRKLP